MPQPDYENDLVFPPQEIKSQHELSEQGRQSEVLMNKVNSNLTGKRFGRLTVICFDHKEPRKNGGGMYGLYCYEPDMTIVIDWQVLAITSASVLLSGVLITTFCAWLSVNKFLRMKAGDLYKI